MDGIKAMKAKAKNMSPILSIGKNGLTKGTFELIDRELSQKGLIKIKFLRAAKEQWPLEELYSQIIATTGATLVDKVGYVIVLYRKKE